MSRVPPQAPGGLSHPPGNLGEAELEHLEELGDDAIIAQQQAAHAPAPRAQVTEEARSVVISDHPGAGSNPPSAPKIPTQASGKKRSERTEKTVVIRDRRQVEELRRQMAAHKAQLAAAPQAAANGGVLLWVIVGVAAFLTGGLVALFATRTDATTTAGGKPVVSSLPLPSAAPVAATAEPPTVSIDELPTEGSKKK